MSSTRCINGVRNCGGADYFTAKEVREWISEDFHGRRRLSSDYLVDGIHESCDDRAHRWRFATYDTYDTAGSALWVCCACSDALYLCRTISYMIQELPI